jgi:hypothetical protein
LTNVKAAAVPDKEEDMMRSGTFPCSVLKVIDIAEM